MTNVRHKDSASKKTIQRVLCLSRDFSLIKDNIMHLISTDSVTEYKRRLCT